MIFTELWKQRQGEDVLIRSAIINDDACTIISFLCFRHFGNIATTFEGSLVRINIIGIDLSGWDMETTARHLDLTTASQIIGVDDHQVAFDHDLLSNV